MAFMFEKLAAYQRTVAFADEVAAMADSFPRGYGFFADQLNRAAMDSAANIAEGNERFTKPDRKNFFGIARGSVQESQCRRPIVGRCCPGGAPSVDLLAVALGGHGSRRRGSPTLWQQFAGGRPPDVPPLLL